MAKKKKPGATAGPPGSGDYEAFSAWLTEQPRDWAVVIACRAALRALPLLAAYRGHIDIFLPVFRAAAVSRLAAKYPTLKIATIASAASADAADAADAADTVAHASRAVDAAYGAYAAAGAVVEVNAAAYAARAARAPTAKLRGEVQADVARLHAVVMTARELASAPLWETVPAPDIMKAWQGLTQELSRRGRHWSVWIDWYSDALHSGSDEDEYYHRAFTDIPGELPWDKGAKAVNAEIARRLGNPSSVQPSIEIPDQSPAPIRIVERDGKISKADDRDSALSVVERDFRDWRDPIVDHIGELSRSDFGFGTNHSRVRQRLLALDELLVGEVDEVKDRQFRIGYEIDRFDALLAAYRLGGDDVPVLNATQLEDLNHLRVALMMGIGKLERWVEFNKLAHANAAGEGDADRRVIAEALDEIVAVMELHEQYFDPELPATFRFLSEAVRDPVGATKTIAYGAVKSAENLVSFLARRSLGLGQKVVDAVETHISKAVAASLIAGFSGAALALSGALPQGWVWLKPLLAAIGVGG